MDGRETGKGKNRFKIRDLFMDERCTRPVLDFLRTTEVGRRTGLREEEREGVRDEGPESEEGVSEQEEQENERPRQREERE